MKLKELQEIFPVIQKVYDNGVKDFQRRVDLVPAYKELKGWQDHITEEQQRIQREYGNEQGQIPQGALPEANQKFRKILEGEIPKPKKSLKFTIEEVKEADLSGSELALIYEDFIKE